MTTLAPSLAAISRVVFQPWSVRTTVSVFCFKSAISASCFPGLTFSRLIKITDSSDMAYLLLRGRCPLTVDPGCSSRTTRAPHAAHPCCFGHTKDDPKAGNGSRHKGFFWKAHG